MNREIVLVVRRTIKADVARVFDAWTQAEQLRRWWGPAPVTCSGAEVDLRVGGAYRIDNLLPDGTVLRILGEFEVVEPPHRLVYSWHVERAASTAGEASRVSVSFTPRDGGTEVVIVHERIDSEPTRVNHEHGWNGCLDGLARLLERSGAFQNALE
jgi:uncharacterized protein YndB with AHSA1/START domain